MILPLAGPAPLFADPVELDRVRIQRHLETVESELRARDVSHLPPELQAERRRNLDRLHAYRLAGEFPRNSGHPGERVPYFIDDDGVACAVGHLVIESGFAAVAGEIHETENFARLLDMTHPALPGWIAASGLTAEECARIQPQYCACEQDFDPVCGVDGKSYLNPCYAETCAGVAIAHKGVCEGESSSGWPPPGEGTSESSGSGSSESTSSSSTDDHGSSTGSDEPGGSSSSTGGSSGGPDTTGTADPASTTNDASSGEAESSAGHDARGSGCDGCSLGERGADLMGAALLLGLRRRRRS